MTSSPFPAFIRESKDRSFTRKQWMAHVERARALWEQCPGQPTQPLAWLFPRLANLKFDGQQDAQWLDSHADFISQAFMAPSSVWEDFSTDSEWHMDSCLARTMENSLLSEFLVELLPPDFFLSFDDPGNWRAAINPWEFLADRALTTALSKFLQASQGQLPRAVHVNGLAHQFVQNDEDDALEILLAAGFDVRTKASSFHGQDCLDVALAYDNPTAAAMLLLREPGLASEPSSDGSARYVEVLELLQEAADELLAENALAAIRAFRKQGMLEDQLPAVDAVEQSAAGRVRM